MSSFIVIPDTQGEVSLLYGLLEQIFDRNLLKDRKLVFLGDYMNRGEGTKQLLDECIELKKLNHVFLRGNHEDVLIRAYLAYQQKDEFYRDIYIYQWLKMESNTLFSYGISKYRKNNLRIFLEFVEALENFGHLNFLLSLPAYYESDNIIMIHAGIKPNLVWELQKSEIDSLLDSYEYEIEQIYSFELAKLETHKEESKKVVSGHSTRDEPFVSKNRVMLDCGAGKPGKPLVAWVSDTNEILYSYKK
jgi:serine/threonine protein phosphatase 1